MFFCSDSCKINHLESKFELVLNISNVFIRSRVGARDRRGRGDEEVVGVGTQLGSERRAVIVVVVVVASLSFFFRSSLDVDVIFLSLQFLSRKKRKQRKRKRFAVPPCISSSTPSSCSQTRAEHPQLLSVARALARDKPKRTRQSFFFSLPRTTLHRLRWPAVDRGAPSAMPEERKER